MKLDARIKYLDINSGDKTQIGMGYGSDGWQTLFHSVTRTVPTTPTMRERLDWLVKAQGGSGVLFHNIGGLFEPEAVGTPDFKADMRFEQIDLSLQKAFKLPVADPSYAQVMRRVNYMELIQAAETFPYKVVGYIGAPHRLGRIGQESQTSWLKRALLASQVIIRIADIIGLDNTMGSRAPIEPFFDGANGVVADLVKAYDSLGKEVWVEPFNYKSDLWLAHRPKMMSEKFLRQMSAAGWPKRAMDHEEPSVPGSRGEAVYVLMETDWRWTTPQMVDYLNKFQQEFPEFNQVVYAGHLRADILV